MRFVELSFEQPSAAARGENGVLRLVWKRLVLGIVGAALAANACAAQTDLVVLPASADTWRITAGTWGGQAELTGDSVVVPTSGYIAASARVSGGQRDVLGLEWKDHWHAALRLERREPLDLRPYLDGTLEFDLEVTELGKGGVRATLGCGDGCERGVNLIEPARAWAGKGRQHVALAMRCFVRDGADFSKVSLPFSLQGAGAGRVSVANIRITSVAKARLAAAGTPPEVIFIGDSITQGWENEGRSVWQRRYAHHHALAVGFGGDRTENVLWRLQHGVHVLDLSAALLNADGTLSRDVMPDLLHLSEKGYAIWQRAMEPMLDELLGPLPHVARQRTE